MVLEILDQSLDMSFGELPRNLSSLYRYLIKRLTEVHATLDVNTLEECKGIIGNIANGFAQAYEQVKKGVRPASGEGPLGSGHRYSLQLKCLMRPCVKKLTAASPGRRAGKKFPPPQRPGIIFFPAAKSNVGMSNYEH